MSTENNPETLVPCPCGKAPECLPGRHYRQVACRRCGRRGPLAPDEDLAIKLWNNDYPPVAVWNKTIPTVDGVYWWRLSENDPDPDICETDIEYGFVHDIGEPMGEKISERGGEWLGPIVPSPDVIAINDYVTLLERNNGRLREVLKEALEQTGCDGDLCNYRWHEKARVLLGE